MTDKTQQGQEETEKRGGTEELSIDEMNALRKKLGLGPLKQTTSKAQDEVVVSSSSSVDHKKKPNASEEKEKEGKPKRKSLGEELKDEDADALAWVTKHKLTDNNPSEEGQKQSHKATVVVERKRKQRYTSDSLSGMRVAHEESEMAEAVTEDGVVLTLKDANVLDGDEVNKDEDVLENVAIAEEEKRLKAKEAAKPKVPDKYGDLEFQTEKDGQRKKPPSLLPQYEDEEDTLMEEKNRGIVLGRGGKVELKKDEEKEEKEYPPEKMEIDASTSEGGVAKEFATKGELSFKKKKKKGGKIRVKLEEEQEETSLQIAPTALSDQSRDHGSRRSAAAIENSRAEEDRIMKETEERQKSYEQALEKAKTQSLTLMRTATRQTTEDDEDHELFKSLQEARKLASEKKVTVAPLKELLSQTAGKEEQLGFEGGLKLNSTAEFVKGLEHIAETQESPISMAVEAAPEETTTRIVKKEAVKEETTPLTQGMQEEQEPLVSQGVAATLRMLQQCEGGAEAIKKNVELEIGRTKDGTFEDVNDLAPQIKLEYVDDEGRLLKPKEAFRFISHKFHGRTPGKKKQEKLMKRVEEAQRKKHMDTTDTPLQTVAALKTVQQQTHLPYVVLTGTGSEAPLLLKVKKESEPTSETRSAASMKEPTSKEIQNYAIINLLDFFKKITPK